MDHSQLPYVDEHTISIDAPPEDVGPALLEVVERSFSGPAQAVLVSALGCTDRAASGPRPLARGSAVPGFHIAAANRPEELLLVGRHRFSVYALGFRVEASGSGTRLCAQTRAAFPGLTGRLYRALVIGTRAHVLVLHGMFALIRRRAQPPVN